MDSGLTRGLGRTYDKRRILRMIADETVEIDLTDGESAVLDLDAMEARVALFSAANDRRLGSSPSLSAEPSTRPDPLWRRLFRR